MHNLNHWTVGNRARRLIPAPARNQFVNTYSWIVKLPIHWNSHRELMVFSSIVSEKRPSQLIVDVQEVHERKWLQHDGAPAQYSGLYQ